jgi:hypothetical protein
MPVGRWDYGTERATGFTNNAYCHPRKAIVDLLTKRVRGRRSSPIAVKVALQARSFVPTTVSKKTYATAWDGNVVIRATTTGNLKPATRQ